MDVRLVLLAKLEFVTHFPSTTSASRQKPLSQLAANIFSFVNYLSYIMRPWIRSLRTVDARRVTQRCFSSSRPRLELRSIWDLDNKIDPVYRECTNRSLEIIKFPEDQPPNNVLLIQKEGVPSVTEAMVEFAKYLKTAYPATNIILEPHIATELHSSLPFPIHATPYTTLPPYPNRNPYHLKTSLTVTFGGDGTILHAASLFSTSPVVPPLLSFSLGTLGFLGPWKFSDYRAAITAVFTNKARIMRRSRIKMEAFSGSTQLLGDLWPPDSQSNGGRGEGSGVWAMNEVNIHRGQNPHMAIVEVFVDGRFLTEAVADGIILSTPTGSTAYSLSSFGSIVHPRVPAILLTPICPRSLSFRPLVLPAEVEVSLKLSDKARGDEVEVSIDGKRWGGVRKGVEVKITGEMGNFCGGGEGGVPCIWREGSEHEDEWVGGLNGLLKFNYPFGEEPSSRVFSNIDGLEEKLPCKSTKRDL
ncbi:NADH kinase pos5 [Orbilia oligospora]|uniref:NADH kinase pos5 n=1 Tax=Orbilia oligospora TaxID=2813651 RepID=A0A6G1MLS6_ORBOL|nr:NADH kinase pos5 [Orbilia oligospora]KAF3261179.1 NADH kinase pos5 [Orbilia oligospora]